MGLSLILRSDQETPETKKYLGIPKRSRLDFHSALLAALGALRLQRYLSFSHLPGRQEFPCPSPFVPTFDWRLRTSHPRRSAERTLIMGILNVTPDSFSDGDRFLLRHSAALDHALAMLDERR